MFLPSQTLRDANNVSSDSRESASESYRYLLLSISDELDQLALVESDATPVLEVWRSTKSR